MEFDPDEIFRHLMIDIFNEAAPAYWRQRAQVLLAARPTAADAVGTADVEQLRERWRRLTATAAACENKARFIELGYEDWPDVDDFIANEFTAGWTTTYLPVLEEAA